MSIPIDVLADVKLSKAKEDLKVLTKKYKEALSYIEVCESQKDVALALSKTKRSVTTPVTTKAVKKGREATAISILSDIHCEAVIEAKSVNGLNSYNPDVAQARMKNYADNLVRLTRKERQDIPINNLVLHFGGDMLNGSLHADDKLTNAMTTQEAILFCDELLTEALGSILDNGEFKKIDVVCSVGNHGRSTIKMPTGEAAYRTSYEYIIYQNLRRKFAKEGKVTFHLPESYFSYLEVYGKLLRFSHGDGYRGNPDAIGAHFEKANQAIKAYHDFVGHWHSLMYAPSFTRNNCVIGVTPYTLLKGYSIAPPSQSFQLLDSKLGMTVTAPIFLDE